MLATQRALPFFFRTVEPKPGCAGRVVQGPDHALLRHEIGDDLLLPPHVVAGRDAVGARLEHLHGQGRGDTEPAGQILPVDYLEIRAAFLQIPGCCLSARFSDDVAEEEDGNKLIWHILPLLSL